MALHQSLKQYHQVHQRHWVHINIHHICTKCNWCTWYLLKCNWPHGTGERSTLSRWTVHLNQVAKSIRIQEEVWWEKRPWWSQIDPEDTFSSSRWRSLTPCYSSVVMTVFMIGIFDSFFFTVMLSVTSHGEISSRLVLAWKFIFFVTIVICTTFLDFQYGFSVILKISKSIQTCLLIAPSVFD